MGFFDLPNELILLLTAHLEHTDEINALCCTNRWLHELLNPVLYKCSTTSRNGGYTLEWAARCGELSTARLILQAGVPPNACGGEQWQPLALATIHGHIEIIKLLLDHGVDPCSINNNWTNQNWKRPQFHPGQSAEEEHFKKGFQKEGHPLSLAASAGQLSVIKLLLQYGVPSDLRSTGDEKHIALHLAARKGHIDIVRILADVGSSIDALTGSGFTPLALAANKGYLDIVRFLLEHGADPNIPSSNGSTLLSQASISGNISIVRCLFDHGATLTPSYPNSQEPIYPICYAAERGYDEIVDLLLSKYDYIQSSTKAYQRVILLCVAAMTGRTALLTDLLQQHHYDPNVGLDPRLQAVFCSYSTPAFPHRRPQAAISWAAAYNQVAAIEILISNGASITPPNRDFPLICAIQRGHKDAIRTLLAHGVNPNDPPGEALDQAVPNPDIFFLLLSYNADPTNSLPNIRMSWNIVLSGQVDTLRILLDHPKGPGVVANPISESSCPEGSLTPLFRRALHGGEQIFRVLLDRGLLVKPKEPSGSSARSALTEAIRGGTSFARLLLDMGFVATADKMGFVYHCASNHKDPDCLLDLFLQNGCSIDDMDASGRTAFFAAAQVGNVRCMQHLLKKGASLQVVCWGETPLSVAAKGKHFDAVKMILQAFDELKLLLDEVEGMLKKAEYALKASQADILKALRQFRCRRLYPVRA